MSTKYVYINDTFINEEEAAIRVPDLAVQRGYGVFDFFKTIGGRPIFLQDHLDRFFHSAATLHLNVKQSREELENIITELCKKNAIPDSGIKITLTGGYSADGYTLPEEPNLLITQQHLNPPLVFQSKGINVVSYEYQRQLSEAKTLDYSMGIWLQPFIKENGADDVVYHADGLLKETPRANFFIVTKDGEVLTAAHKVLKGVIRKNLLALENSGYSIQERDFTIQDLANASEAFITSTTKHVLPVLHVNGTPVGDGKAGKVSERLFDLLLEKVKHQ